MEKLLGQYNASPYSLFPLNYSKQIAASKGLKPVRTSLKTFQGKEKLGIDIDWNTWIRILTYRNQILPK